MVVGSGETPVALASPFEHVVNFYDREEDFVAQMGVYLADSLIAGDAVVIVVGPSQRHAFEAAFVAAGIDVPAAQIDGGLLIVDAADALERFMVDGAPDTEALEDLIGGLLDRASAAGRPVRVYGEMVSVLWQGGNVAAALEVERLWNVLGAGVPLSLFCAYPSAIAADTDASAAFDQVCQAHSEVIGELPTATRAAAKRTFSGDLHAPRDARLFVEATLADWCLDDLIGDAVLVVSELTTNAVIHAGSDVDVTVSRLRSGVRLAVSDTSAVAPQPRDWIPAVAGGWGMQVVSSIASRWGHGATHGGKVVWAELEVTSGGRVRR